jgi:hypothetical protein
MEKEVFSSILGDGLINVYLTPLLTSGHLIHLLSGGGEMSIDK